MRHVRDKGIGRFVSWFKTFQSRKRAWLSSLDKGARDQLLIAPRGCNGPSERILAMGGRGPSSAGLPGGCEVALNTRGTPARVCWLVAKFFVIFYYEVCDSDRSVYWYAK